MKTISSMEWMVARLHDLKTKHLYRQFRVLENVKGTTATLEGRNVTLFCGNDYLGLSQHPKLVEAAQRVLGTHGVGAGSARLIAGTSDRHVALEARIANFLGKERALLFSSGYLANLGALSALSAAGDLVILDKLSHASLIDAANLSKAAVRIYPHGNLSYLEKLLKRRSAKRAWIVTDSIFSMGGDLAPLQELVELKNRYGAYLVIDEAHATGVFGATGKGVSEHLGVLDDIDVHIGTCSKAIGTFGGFVAGSNELIQYLVNGARTFIFDTALPPAVCAASVQALDLIASEPGLRRRLWQNIGALKASGPIIPIVIGDEQRTLEVAEALFDRGFLIPAVRYPTVPKGKARLRLTVSAAHSDEQINGLLEELGNFL